MTDTATTSPSKPGSTSASSTPTTSIFHPDHIQQPILPPGTSVVIYDIDPDTPPAAIAAVLESGIDAYLLKATPPVLAAQIDALWRTTRRLGRDGQPGV